MTLDVSNISTLGCSAATDNAASQGGGLREAMKSDPPRLVLKFQRGPNGEEQFDWGVVGTMPLMSTIGYIADVQTKLLDGCLAGGCSKHDNETKALVIWYDAAPREQRMKWAVHPDIPRHPLVGMLEMVKSVLVAMQLRNMEVAEQAIKKPRLFGPDGLPAGR